MTSCLHDYGLTGWVSNVAARAVCRKSNAISNPPTLAARSLAAARISCVRKTQESSLARRLDDDAGCVDGRIRLAERGNDAVAAAFRRTQIHEKHLVFLVVDDFR